MGWLNGHTLDWILLAYGAWATLAGFRAGFVMAVYGLVGRLAAIYVAWRVAPALAGSPAGVALAARLAGWLAARAAAGPASAGQAAPAAALTLHTAHLLVWVICVVLVLFVVAFLLMRTVRIVSGVLNLLPVIGQINRLGGAVAGLGGAVAGVAVLCVLAASARGWFHSPTYDDVLATSRAATTLAPVGRALLAEAARLAPAIAGAQGGLPAGLPALPGLGTPPTLRLPLPSGPTQPSTGPTQPSTVPPR